jgi:hypothetical protein
MDQAELDEQERFDRRQEREKVEKRRQELRSRVIAAARNLRDASCGIPGLGDEWGALDDALRALTEYAESTLSSEQME